MIPTDLFPHPDGLGFLLGLPFFGVSNVVSLGLHEVVVWISAGTATLVTALGDAIETSTAVPFDSGFVSEFFLVTEVGAALALPLLFLAIIQAILKQDLGLIVRAAFVRLPLAILFGDLAVEIVRLALSISDQFSRVLLDLAGGPVHQFLSSMGAEYQSSGQLGTLGFAGLLLAVLGALIAFVLWLELAIRSGAIAVATLFIPLALAGTVWPVTSHWARRLGETIAALIFAKPIIAAVLSLAVTSISSGQGINTLVEGIALLILATAAPFSVLKIIPFAEAGAMSQFEGLSRRAMKAGHGAVVEGAATFHAAKEHPSDAETPGVGFLEASATDPDLFAQYFEESKASLDLRAASRSDSEGSTKEAGASSRIDEGQENGSATGGDR